MVVASLDADLASPRRARVTPAGWEGWIRALGTRIPVLEAEIVRRVRNEIPEYFAADGAEGVQVGVEVQRAVRCALVTFARGPRQPRLRVADAELFRRLGALEADAGRQQSALQAGFRTASESVVRDIAVWERDQEVPVDIAAGLSRSAARFIDTLARIAADGYQQRLAAQRRRETGAWVLEMVSRRGGIAASALQTTAARIGWSIPERCVIAQLAAPHVPATPPPGVLDAVFGQRVLTGTVAGRELVLLSGTPFHADLPRLLAECEPALRVFLGTEVALAEASVSARLARRAADLFVDAPPGITRCADHLLELLADAGADPVTAMGEARLAPLAAQPPAKRAMLGELLSAWLEFGGLKGDAPGVLDASRQTLSYRMQRLQVLFGDQLHERDARLELMLALRQVLPSWKADAGAAARRGTRRARR